MRDIREGFVRLTQYDSFGSYDGRELVIKPAMISEVRDMGDHRQLTIDDTAWYGRCAYSYRFVRENQKTILMRMRKAEEQNCGRSK